MSDFIINSIHIHLLLNHFPIVLSVLTPAILLYGVAKKDREITELSLMLYAATGLIVIPVYLSGQVAIKTVSGIPGIDIHALVLHERIAGITAWLIFCLGVASFIILNKSRRNVFKNYTSWHYIILIASLIIFIAVAFTGYYGGSIRHTEIHGSSP